VTDRRPTSRWERSEVTYGPVGRCIATFVVLVVPLYFAFFSLPFLIAASIWLCSITPMALRQIWRKTPIADAPPQIIIPPDPAPLAPGKSISDRTPPTRW
jgi:hypothetical protein